MPNEYRDSYIKRQNRLREGDMESTEISLKDNSAGAFLELRTSVEFAALCHLNNNLTKEEEFGLLKVVTAMLIDAEESLRRARHSFRQLNKSDFNEDKMNAGLTAKMMLVARDLADSAGQATAAGEFVLFSLGEVLESIGEEPIITATTAVVDPNQSREETQAHLDLLNADGIPSA